MVHWFIFLRIDKPAYRRTSLSANQYSILDRRILLALLIGMHIKTKYIDVYENQFLDRYEPRTCEDLNEVKLAMLGIAP